MNLKFEATYKLVRAGVSIVKGNGITALSLLSSEMFDRTAVSAMESLNDGVILLTLKDIEGKFQRFARVKKSPIANFYSEEVPYDIVGNKPSFPASFATAPTPSRIHPDKAALDDVSRVIISELQKDGRKTYEELGKKVGYTGMAIKKRVKNLLKRDAVKVSALLNVDKMNMRLAVTMLEIATAEDLNLLINRLRNCPRIVNMFTTLGGYSTVVLSVAEDPDTLQSFSLKRFSLNRGTGIRRSDFYPTTSTHYSPHFLVRMCLGGRDGDITPCKSNCRTCQRYQDNKCVGCPATRSYRGSL
jgi:Lrp/AsnC family transcriptional regulator for asnA, asnC and gidA